MGLTGALWSWGKDLDTCGSGVTAAIYKLPLQLMLVKGVFKRIQNILICASKNTRSKLLQESKTSLALGALTVPPGGH
jgi:hypothetical protein